MRFIMVTLILSLGACASVEKRTERASGVGFNSYDVPNSGGNMPVVVSN